MDRSEYFKNPVSRTQVPDYFDVIAKPICWRDIDNKLDQNAYWNLKDFQVRILLKQSLSLSTNACVSRTMFTLLLIMPCYTINVILQYTEQLHESKIPVFLSSKSYSS